MLLAVRISSYARTWEVWRALKKLELHSAIASCNSYASLGKKSQQYVGSLKREPGAKVTRCCLSLFFKLHKDLESQIGVAS